MKYARYPVRTDDFASVLLRFADAVRGALGPPFRLTGVGDSGYEVRGAAVCRDQVHGRCFFFFAFGSPSAAGRSGATIERSRRT